MRPELTREQRLENVRKLMKAIEKTDLDFHTLQLAVIDVSRSALQHFFVALPEEEKKDRAQRIEEASRRVAEVLNTVTKSAGEDMLVLLALLDQAVTYGYQMRGLEETNVSDGQGSDPA